MKYISLAFVLMLLFVQLSYGQSNISNVPLNFNYYTTNNALSGINSKFNGTANTKGSRYLFDNWVNGSVTTLSGALVTNDSIYYNMDKIKNSLLLRKPDGEVVEVEKSQVQSFNLTHDNTYNFERVKAIDPNQYLEVLAKKENGYALYKSITTTFKKSDYNTDGLMQSGSDFDEYKDAYKYYLVMPDKTYKIIALKLKSLKDAFAGNAKANDYFSKHKNDAVDESYLTALINYVNNN